MFFDGANEISILYIEIKLRRLSSQKLTWSIFQFYFKKITALFKKATSQKKLLQLIKRTIDDNDIDDIGNLDDSPRFVFIDEKCENLIVVNGDGELTRTINQKKKSGVLQQLIINVN